ncbi:MAG: translesion DNA synthesis-associated protein ImuA [Salinicola sp.]|uniref:translesion DNA synthesis-associated protein ImuA n=1 Tax=Salinicola sp. TaxID=1978524 RepID=UPI001DFFD06A|nr:translesion DNA synthesis-associated protein ImuA [Salinicola sp.]NRB54687.1 translesion DNA synthesis-associated protein ImuA [Salinicola sp.]
MSGLESLLASRQVWRAQTGVDSDRGGAIASGHAELDALLPGGGWPPAAISELLSSGAGNGELALLWPVLSRLTRQGRPIVLVSPPGAPYPAAWRRAGVVLEQCHWLDVQGREALWATEQCLRAGCCGAVVAWLAQADGRLMRRLQVAAASGDTLAFVHRPLAKVAEASPAPLRLRLHRHAELEVLKCRGGLAPSRRIAFGGGA